MKNSQFAIVPAAGVGSRMGGQLPKQFMRIGQRTVLDYTLQALLSCVTIERIVVILSSSHEFNEQLFTLEDERLDYVFQGGVSRAQSVLNGLESLRSQAAPDDWILVHDAARPCVDQGLIEQLIRTLKEDPVGGILALPMSDTIKLADEQGRILATQDRRHLWAAQTPQMFRYELLYQALSSATDNVTDEASAVEQMGFRPKLIPSQGTNIKITYPADLLLAENILKVQGRYD